MRIAIIGGGIAGLAAAYELEQTAPKSNDPLPPERAGASLGVARREAEAP